MFYPMFFCCSFTKCSNIVDDFEFLVLLIVAILFIVDDFESGTVDDNSESLEG